MYKWILPSLILAKSILCPNYTQTSGNPLTVHEVRPGDITCIGAMGDSITAGFGAGAKSLLTDFIEWRGLSFSIGGDDDTVTLPNIIKTFVTPPATLYGPSTGKSIRLPTPLITGLNVAVSGARGHDMPSQAKRLISLVKKADEFKHITMFIGQNDLCSDICQDIPTAEPTAFASYIEEALDLLQSKLPRTIVSIVLPVNVTELFTIGRIFCHLIHNVECQCGNDGPKKQQVTDTIAMYWEKLETLAKNPKYDTDDFTVVIQPYMINISVPTVETVSYFAPDCFHFSEKGHAASAVALWNSLLEPVGKKRTDWTPGEGLNCPTDENPYIFTFRNSKPDFKPAKSIPFLL